MNAIVIEHVPLTELPAAWRSRLGTLTHGRVTVRIEAETDKAPLSHDAVDDNALFGMWRDRTDMADVGDYMRDLRAPRFGIDSARDSK